MKHIHKMFHPQYDSAMTSVATELHPLTLRMLGELTLRPDGGETATSGPDHAVALATAHFMALERVDMGALAREAGVGRVTLYRWFGDRESLLARVMWSLSRQCLRWLAAQSEPTLDHTLGSVRAFMEVTRAYPPLRHFMDAEPAVALRAMLEPTSPLVAALTDWAEERLTKAGFGAELAGTSGLGPSGPGADELADVLVSVTSTYCWARVIAGGEADIDGAMRAVRVLLRA